MNFSSHDKTAAKLVGVLTALVLLGGSCGDSSDNSDPDRLDKSLTCADYLSGGYIPIPGPGRIGSDYSRQQSIISDCKDSVAIAEPERAPEPNASLSTPPPASTSTAPRVSTTTQPPDPSDLDIWWDIHGDNLLYLASLNRPLVDDLNLSSTSVDQQLACERSAAKHTIPSEISMNEMIDSAPRDLSQTLDDWYINYRVMMSNCLNGHFVIPGYTSVLEEKMNDALDAFE